MPVVPTVGTNTLLVSESKKLGGGNGVPGLIFATMCLCLPVFRMKYMLSLTLTHPNKNSSGDEIANVNFFFYNIAHVEASAYAH